MKSACQLRHLLILLYSAVLATLAGCQSPPSNWRLTELSGHMPDLSFRLTNDTGQQVSATDYRGKVVMLFFGYTHCPDVCPTTLARLHAVLESTGAAAKDVRILFVSVDPARDTPAILHVYVNAFDPRAVGLYGSPHDLEKLAKRYRTSFTREPKHDKGRYEVSHSSAVYIFDRAGRARLLATPAATQQELVHDLSLLLASGE